MSAPVEPGLIRIRAAVRGGTIASVAITSSRPLSLATAFAGKPLSAVTAAVASLHGLCGQSHAAAMAFAGAVATGETPQPEERIRWVRRLAGERIAEHLRYLFAADPDLGPDRLATLRAALAIAGAAARTGRLDADAATRLRAALSALCLDDGTALPPLQGDPPDRLTPADDAAVVDALAADPAMIRRPVLPGRCPQTGPAARCGRSAADLGAGTAARRAELADAVDLLADPENPAAGDGNAWISAGSAGASAGYAAVETPRGRLHTRVVVQGDGRLLDARVLAPTEWNFHPDGPLVRSLVGTQAGDDAAAAVSRLAAAFDPCVAFKVEVEDAGHA